MNGNVRQANARAYGKPDLLLRTRRSVMEAAYLMQARRARQRRHAGIALLSLAVLFVLFTPLLWSVANDLSAGDAFFDMPVMVLILSLVLLSAMFAILMKSWRDGRRDARDS